MEDKNKGRSKYVALIILLLFVVAVPTLVIFSMDKKDNYNGKNNVETTDNNKDNSSVDNDKNKDDKDNKVIDNNSNNKTDTNSSENTNSNTSTNSNSNTGTNYNTNSNSSTITNNSNGTGTNNNSGTGSSNSNSNINNNNTSDNGTNSGSQSGTTNKYSDNLSIDNNVDETFENNNNNNYEYEYVDDDEGNIVDNTTISDYGDDYLSTSGNAKRSLVVKYNLSNAPYNNNEYCEEKLSKTFKIKLSEKPGGSTCTDYPTTLNFNEKGTLNVEKHSYNKQAILDFSNAKFSSLGDYYFDIYDSDTNETLYQVIITFRNVTDENNMPLPKTYSLIQIKSILRDGEKVENININVKNPNTYLTIEHEKTEDAILENVYVDLIIDSYNKEIYSAVDGNMYDLVLNKESDNYSNLEIGNHYTIRKDNGFLAQTYQLTNGGKVYVGRRYAASNTNNRRRLVSSANTNDKYQIPVGTKYRAILTKNKIYREVYEVQGTNDMRVASLNESSNKILIKNVTKSNPKTGLFYSIMPFIIIIVIAVVGLIILKKLSIKKEKNK